MSGFNQQNIEYWHNWHKNAYCLCGSRFPTPCNIKQACIKYTWESILRQSTKGISLYCTVISKVNTYTSKSVLWVNIKEKIYLPLNFSTATPIIFNLFKKKITAITFNSFHHYVNYLHPLTPCRSSSFNHHIDDLQLFPLLQKSSSTFSSPSVTIFKVSTTTGIISTHAATIFKFSTTTSIMFYLFNHHCNHFHLFHHHIDHLQCFRPRCFWILTHMG